MSLASKYDPLTAWWAFYPSTTPLSPNPASQPWKMIRPDLGQTAADDVPRRDDRDVQPGPPVAERIGHGGGNKDRDDHDHHRPELGRQRRPLRLVVGTGNPFTNRFDPITRIACTCWCCHDSSSVGLSARRSRALARQTPTSAYKPSLEVSASPLMSRTGQGR